MSVPPTHTGANICTRVGGGLEQGRSQTNVWGNYAGAYPGKGGEGGLAQGSSPVKSGAGLCSGVARWRVSNVGKGEDEGAYPSGRGWGGGVGLDIVFFASHIFTLFNLLSSCCNMYSRRR